MDSSGDSWARSAASPEKTHPSETQTKNCGARVFAALGAMADEISSPAIARASRWVQEKKIRIEKRRGSDDNPDSVERGAIAQARELAMLNYERLKKNSPDNSSRSTPLGKQSSVIAALKKEVFWRKVPRRASAISPQKHILLCLPNVCVCCEDACFYVRVQTRHERSGKHSSTHLGVRINRNQNLLLITLGASMRLVSPQRLKC